MPSGLTETVAQAIEGLASNVVARALNPGDASVALAHIQLLMVSEMAEQQRQMQHAREERLARIAAKRQTLMAFRKKRTTIQELNKLYSQVPLALAAFTSQLQ
jgi:hypothetical protein